MITLIIYLAIIGAVTWALVTYIPMPDGVKKIIIAVAVVCTIIFVLKAFGIGDIPVPQVG